ncbi:hypothetical protein BDM02DRAFT_3185001 [Thelephora ganbajun]|uniref:Uncharacterized protein n=1 Tax=Thelephora ganbajun TaxID=370292 RepID=A0ACB6ZMW3_THEGA|nr:hypothetical protein BDM02DRAFT_3185001 [Thelephora ganbajun]
MANPILQSILLNPSLNSSRSLPSSPALNLSVLPSDDDSNLTQSRKIRFAPLPVVPDPGDIQEEGQYDEFPGPEAESIPATPTPVPPPPLPPVVSFNPSTSSSSSQQSLLLPKKSFSSKFIKPLFTPWSKSISAPSSTVGSPPLSRVSSIESSQSLRLGTPLDRWTSVSSVRSFMSDSGRPQSRKRKSPSFPSTLNPLAHRSKSTPLPAKQYTPSAKPGMRMLNGRVYGRRRPYNKASTDPFVNVSNTEPEFVEWGYGGMGSNKSNTNSSLGSTWRVVQNGSNASAFGNDEDDSSGMAWVRKRRAEREKAKLEAEKKEQQREDADAEKSQSAIADEEERETPRLPKEDNTPHPPVEAPTVAPVEQLHAKPEHITTAINLPPQRLNKREASFAHRIQIPQVESPAKDRSSFGVDVFDMDLGERPEVTPETPEASTGSLSEGEDEDSSPSDEDDEDDSDVYSEENAHSKTAMSAGVEKVSRHKDVPQPKPPNTQQPPLKNQLHTTAIEA